MTEDLTHHYDVIVVGAGPTGATLAALLGQAGHRTLVLERDVDVYPLPRAVHMDHEIMRVLQEIGLEHRLETFGGVADTYLFQNAAGENIVEIRGGGQLAVSGFSGSLMFFQPELEASLRERLRELASVTACFGAELVDFRIDADPDDAVAPRVQVEFEQGGSRLRATGRFLVGCDGAASSVRKALSVPVEDLGFDEPWVVVDCRVRGDTGLPDNISYQFCDPRRPTTTVPAGPGRRRWEFMLLPGETREEMQDEARILALLEPWGGRNALDIVRIAVYRFHAVIASRWRIGPVLLAGDAAHQTPPFMGQGMCSGIRDAANLAWKLDRVLAGRSPAALLDSYQTERGPHVRHVVDTSVGMGRIVCELDPERARLRDQRLLAARAAGDRGFGGPRGGQVARLAAGLLRGDDPAAGWLFPQPFVTLNGAAGRLDALFGCGFRLVVDRLEVLPSAEALDALGVVPVVLNATTGCRETAELSGAKWLQERGVCAALVRPDHYVFGSARDAIGVPGLLQDLGRALADPA
jgi:3-(3-hydroxy-phenyl)propionate hydroxylase